MKKIILVLVLIAATGIPGCDSIFNTRRVTILNDDRNNFITSVYYRSSSMGSEKWSKNQISNDIEPGDSYVLMLGSGTYDFRVIMEDSYYSYTLYERAVMVDNDFTLSFCYQCLNETDKAKVEKVPKKREK